MTRKRLKTYLIDDMQNAPFVHPEYSQSLPCEIVQDISIADIIVGRKRAMFDVANLPDGRQYLLWTHEPFFDATTSWVSRKFLPERLVNSDLNVFNVHNGLVYTDNYYLAPRTRQMKLVDSPEGLNVAHQNKTITFAATYKLSRLQVGGRDVSLNEARCSLALAMHRRERLKIIGRGWPIGVSEDDSRFLNRARSKMDFLKLGNFNLCYENCTADYYVTEKMWEAIAGGCLPIYYSNDTVYQTFPRNSFIDGRDCQNIDDLLALVDQMSCAEMIERINRCRMVYNDVVVQARRDPSRARSLRRLVSFLETL